MLQTLKHYVSLSLAVSTGWWSSSTVFQDLCVSGQQIQRTMKPGCTAKRASRKTSEKTVRERNFGEETYRNGDNTHLKETSKNLGL